jgi:hypothetical protein
LAILVPLQKQSDYKQMCQRVWYICVLAVILAIRYYRTKVEKVTFRRQWTCTLKGNRDVETCTSKLQGELTNLRSFPSCP